jgi:iron(III) transport system permease protein
MFFGSSLFFWSIAAIGAVLLPWHMQQDGIGLTTLFALGQGDAEASSALWQALAHGRFWFWPVLASLLLALPGALPGRNARRRAGFLIWGSGLGLAAIVGQGMAVGIQGWSYDWLTAAFGELNDRQLASASAARSPSSAA